MTAGDIEHGTSTNDEIITGMQDQVRTARSSAASSSRGRRSRRSTPTRTARCATAWSAVAGGVEGDGYSGSSPAQDRGRCSARTASRAFASTARSTAIKKVGFFVQDAQVRHQRGDGADGRGSTARARPRQTENTIFGPQIRGFNYDGAAVTVVRQDRLQRLPGHRLRPRRVAGDVDSDGYDGIRRRAQDRRTRPTWAVSTTTGR
ncbi:MAG: hypothetical protein U0166_05770 [Acidobacteriota bacterium]